MVSFRPLIAPLFVPANRPDRIAKAAASGADAIIVDLEDAVPSQDKETARDALRSVLSSLSVPAFLRVNALGTEWAEADLGFAAQAPLAGIMLPKTQSCDDLREVAERLGVETPVLALVETAAGLANLADITQASNLAQIAFGSVDYALDLNCDHSRPALALARAEIVFRSRVADLPAPIDGVCTEIFGVAVLKDDCAYSSGLGFGGKLAIHPRQLPIITQSFAPTPEEIEWANRVLAAEIESCGAAVQLDGRMIDKPIVEKARRIVENGGDASR